MQDMYLEFGIWIQPIQKEHLFQLVVSMKKKHLLDYFKITDSKNLYLLTSIEKSKYMRYYTLKTHGNSTYRELDVFYSTFNLRETVFFHGLENMMVHYCRKIQRLFVPKFFHDRNTKIFLSVFNMQENMIKQIRLDILNFLTCSTENFTNTKINLETAQELLHLLLKIKIFHCCTPILNLSWQQQKVFLFRF